VEYLALITGYQALLLVVAGLYGLAYVFATRFRRLADRDLVAAADEEPAAPDEEPAAPDIDQGNHRDAEPLTA